MRERLAAWLIPQTADSDQTRRQNILNLVLLALAVPGFLFGVVSAISWLLGSKQAAIGAISGLGVQVFYLLAFWLGRRGKVRQAGYIPVVLLFIIMTGSTYQQGIGHSTMIGFAMVSLTAGILIGIGPALFFTFIETGTYLLIGLAQAAGRLPAPTEPVTTIVLDSAAIGLALVVIIAFFWVNNRELIQSYQRERELTAQLHTQREELEERVASRTYHLERRATQLRAAAEVGRAATTIRDLTTLLTRVTHLISERFGFYHVGIFLLDARGEYAVLQAANSEGGERMLERNHKLEVGQVGIVGYVTGHKVPRIVFNVGEDSIYFDNPDLPETRSEMALPLIVGDNLLGALDVQSIQAGAFSEEDIATLEVLADQVAIAIENARLLKEVQDAFDASQRAYGELGKDTWRAIIGEHTAWGYRYDVNAPETVYRATDYDESLTKQALVRREIVKEKDNLIIPLQVRDEVIGVINIEKDNPKQFSTREEISLLETVADQLSLALESARLYRDTQRRAAQEKMVGEITSRMRESLNIETVIKTTANEIFDSLDLDYVTIRLAEDAGDYQQEQES